MTIQYPRKACKGVNLAEMAVVLALISIVSLLVVSFTTMVNLRSTTGVTKNRVADDVRLSQALLENWVETVTVTYDTPVTVSEDGLRLTATIGGVLYGTELTEDSFTATLPNAKRLHCPIGEIGAMSFQEMKKVADGQLRDAIWFCTAAYTLPHSGGTPVEADITFCINPHVGDVLP